MIGTSKKGKVSGRKEGNSLKINHFQISKKGKKRTRTNLAKKEHILYLVKDKGHYFGKFHAFGKNKTDRKIKSGDNIGQWRQRIVKGLKSKQITGKTGYVRKQKIKSRNKRQTEKYRSKRKITANIKHELVGLIKN